MGYAMPIHFSIRNFSIIFGAAKVRVMAGVVSLSAAHHALVAENVLANPDDVLTATNCRATVLVHAK